MGREQKEFVLAHGATVYYDRISLVMETRTVRVCRVQLARRLQYRNLQYCMSPSASIEGVIRVADQKVCSALARPTCLRVATRGATTCDNREVDCAITAKNFPS